VDAPLAACNRIGIVNDVPIQNHERVGPIVLHDSKSNLLYAKTIFQNHLGTSH